MRSDYPSYPNESYSFKRGRDTSFRHRDFDATARDTDRRDSYAGRGESRSSYRRNRDSYSQSARPSRPKREFKPFPKREKQPKNMIYGLRPVMEAIKAGKEFEKIILQTGLQGGIFQELEYLIHQTGLKAQYVPAPKINFICSGNHQGVVAYLAMVDYARLENVIPGIFEEGRTPLVLVFDRITDVRNFGAMVRTAECAGADAVVVPVQNSAALNEDAVKTSAGALMTVPICREENLKAALHYLKASGIKIFAASEKASMEYTQADFTGPTAFILGSEEDGVSPEFLELCDEQVRIPLMGQIDSLNVSVANGIMLYEALRQRRQA